MSRGPGVRMRAILSAVVRDGIWFVPADATRAEAHALQRAAKALALRGLAKAIYVRRPDARGRWFRHLAVVAVDNLRRAVVDTRQVDFLEDRRRCLRSG